MRRSGLIFLIVAAVAGCNTGIEPDTVLKMDWPAGDLNVAQDSVDSVKVVLTRTHNYNGDLTVIVEGEPAGVTVTGSSTTIGETTTWVMKFRVAANVPLGVYPLTLIVQGDRLIDEPRRLFLHVLAPAAFNVAPDLSAITTIRRAAFPIKVKVNRTNFPAPVALGISGPAGITAVFAANPVSTNEVAATLTVAADVAPGMHTLTLTGNAAPLPNSSSQITVTVTTDLLQLTADTAVSARQGATTRRQTIVNVVDSTAAVALAAENLPSGVTVSFTADTGRVHNVSFVVAPLVAVGSYPVTLRATSAGSPDATALVSLNVVASNVALGLAPDSLSVFQGNSTTAALTLTRTSLDTTVAITFEDVPAGITMTASPATTTGSTSTITATASGAVAAANHSVTVVATPAGWPSNAATRKTLPVTVRAIPPGGGNVLLDWSACAEPVWLASQDGVGAWVRVLPSGGLFRFNVATSRGGFAYRPAGGDSLVIRFLTNAELTTKPINMCPVAPPAKTITGSGVHSGANEIFRYGFGGSSAQSTQATPDFALHGVQPGVQDLVGFATGTATGQRMILTRDLDLANGDNLGPIDLNGPNSFLPTSGTLSASGVLQGESVSHTMTYLTGEGCTPNFLYASAPIITSGAQMYGVPDSYRRLSDMHLVTVTSFGNNRTRTATVTLDRMAAKTAALVTQTPVVTPVNTGGTYRRLFVNVSNFSAAYNQAATWSYQGGGKTVVVRASIGYLFPTAPGTFFTITPPELSSVDGFQPSFGPAPNATGSWQLGLEGGGLGSPCSISYTKNTLSQAGSYQ